MRKSLNSGTAGRAAGVSRGLMVGLAGLLAVVMHGPCSAWAEWIILPESVELQGPQDRQRLLVITGEAGVSVGQAEEVQLVSSNAEVVRVSGEELIPVSDGVAEITFRRDGTPVPKTPAVQVRVVGMQTPHVWSFARDVQPVFSKLGCNSGACHGALAGKGGFRLSLLGYDSPADHFSITRDARARRVDFGDVGRSLLLTKPLGLVPHKGGVRFEQGDQAYQILSGWLLQGAASPPTEEARVTHIEVLPETLRLQPGAEHELLVLAHDEAGGVRDVTRWAKFTATHEPIATVNDQGRLTVVGPGEGAIVAWYDSRISLARVKVPFPYDVPAEVYAESPRENFIDELVLDQLEQLRLRPSPRAEEAVLVRRAFLDTLGILPTPQEVRTYLDDSADDKWEQFIERLLARPEFVDYWAHRWSDLFLVNGRLLRPDAVKAYYQWIRSEVEANTPWDELAQRVVLARGSSLEQGATNFYAIHQSPEEMSENVSQAFLGLSIGCAKCHNHPLEKWTNDQYYAMANLFARVRAKGWGGDPRGGDGKRVLYVEETGDLIQPSRGKPQPPAPLDGQPLEIAAAEDRREALADWLTAPENPYFSRAIVNRVWANFLGVGLVEEVDDLRLSNPASNEPLLTALAEFLVDQKYDLKSLMREILRSETYRRSSQPLAENAGDARYYSRHYPRRLSAEVLHDAICQVTGVPSKFTHLENTDGSTSETQFYPVGTRAIQLYDSAVVSSFLRNFGRNERAITCECERSNEPTVVQVLQISNGDIINDKLRQPGSRVETHLQAGLTLPEIIEEAFLLALAREPTSSERERLLAELREPYAAAEATTASQPDPQPAEESAQKPDSPHADDPRRLLLEDLYWSILTSREFLFQR